MTRAELEQLYAQWLASNPQVQSRTVGATGDNESYQPGYDQSYVNFNGQNVDLYGNRQGDLGTLDYANPDGTSQYSSARFNYDPQGGFSPLNFSAADRPDAGGWLSNNHELAAALGIGGMAGAAFLGAGAAGAGAGEAAGTAGAYGAEGFAYPAAAEAAGGLSGGATAAGGTAAGGGLLSGGTGAAGTGLLGSTLSAANGPLGAAALGAAAGLSGSGPVTSTSSQTLPAYLQPYADQYAAQVAGLAQKPYTPYTGQGVAGLTTDQQQAAQLVRDQSGYQNPVTMAGQSQMTNTINGDYLDPASNPYLQSTFDQASKRMEDAYKRGTVQTNAAFHDAGSFGSARHQDLSESNNRAFGDSLANLGNQIYGGNYQQERSRQATATGQAPAFSGTMQQNSLRGADALNASGAVQQGNAQQQLDWQKQQWDTAQAYPYKQADTFAGLFNTNLGRNTTQTQPGVSQSAGLLGGAAAGMGLYRNYAGLFGNQQQPQDSNGFMPYTQSGSYYPGY